MIVLLEVSAYIVEVDICDSFKQHVVKLSKLIFVTELHITHKTTEMDNLVKAWTNEGESYLRDNILSYKIFLMHNKFVILNKK